MKCVDVTYSYRCEICTDGRPYGPNNECPYYKEDKMEKIAVHVPSRYLWEAVEKHEVEVRGKEGLNPKYHNWYIYKEKSCIGIRGKALEYGTEGSGFSHGSVMTVDEYFQRFGEDAPIKIGQYEVKNIDSEGFNVGCQRVTWEVFDKIAAKRPK